MHPGRDIIDFRQHLAEYSEDKVQRWSDGRGQLNYMLPHEEEADFAREIISGLKLPQKHISPKFFYDEKGSQLFEDICRQPEYYLTRSEHQLLEGNVQRIHQDALEGENLLVELGSGSSEKTKIFFRDWTRSEDQCHYVPIDISTSVLQTSIPQLLQENSALWITGLSSSYMDAFHVIRDHATLHLSLFFLGSNIGNFTIEGRRVFFEQVVSVLQDDDIFVFGADLIKNTKILEAAYNDRAGVTAQFNLNILRRLNRELDADFDLSQFRHRAFYNNELGRIEMHLESCQDQKAKLNGDTVSFLKGESIHTENSYKFDVPGLTGELKEVGLSVRDVITDSNEMFSLWIVSS